MEGRRVVGVGQGFLGAALAALDRHPGLAVLKIRLLLFSSAAELTRSRCLAVSWERTVASLFDRDPLAGCLLRLGRC